MIKSCTLKQIQCYRSIIFQLKKISAVSRGQNKRANKDSFLTQRSQGSLENSWLQIWGKERTSCWLANKDRCKRGWKESVAGFSLSTFHYNKMMAVTFPAQISNKGLGSRIYKEIEFLKNGQKTWNITFFFSRADFQMSNEHLKKWSIPSAIRKWTFKPQEKLLHMNRMVKIEKT